MTNFLHRLRRIFHPISRRAAVEIARAACLPDSASLRVLDCDPASLRIYHLPKEPFWIVSVPRDNGAGAIQSSHVVLVSKATGKVLYSGSVHDEG